jgi:quercetin dioxygenase-like cupin family protein
MEVFNALDKSPSKIETFPYKGKPYKVKDVWIRWLSQAGPKDSPEYGLRFFTIGPAGEIPIHNHFYYQTMFILSGRAAVFSHEPETDRVKDERTAGPFDVVFVPTMEPHSIKNLSASDPVLFLCCVGHVYEEEDK